MEAIDCLVRTRSDVGICDDNGYVFAVPTRGSTRSLNGSKCLKSIVDSCFLERPEAIKTTKLRKYMATVAQIADLNETEWEWLALHLGHDVVVHKSYYRQQEHVIELAKVAKLLIAFDCL